MASDPTSIREMQSSQAMSSRRDSSCCSAREECGIAVSSVLWSECSQALVSEKFTARGVFCQAQLAFLSAEVYSEFGVSSYSQADLIELNQHPGLNSLVFSPLSCGIAVLVRQVWWSACAT